MQNPLATTRICGPLRVVVLVKQVPDTANITGEAMKADGTVNRAALPAIFNPEDLNALEEALRLRERYGGRVTVLTMGPPAAVQVLREALFRGADEVILLSDRRFAGADTLATSYTLAQAVRRLGPIDVVLCGRQAIDGDTAQVGPQVAEKLGLPQITCVSRIGAVEEAPAKNGDNGGGAPTAASGRAPSAHGAELTITATRSIEGGYETVRASLPALLTITDEANTPRPPSVKLVCTYKNAAAEAMPLYDDSYLDPESDAAEVCLIDHAGRPVCRAKVIQWDAEAIEADDERIGLRGSPTRVKDIESVVLAQAATRLVEPTPNGIASLVRELVQEHILG
jgi:electron transfer flavoprotein beta subunit